MPAAALALRADPAGITFGLYDIDEGGLTGSGEAVAPIACGTLRDLGTAPRFHAHAPDGTILAEERWAPGRPHAYEDVLAGALGLLQDLLGRDRLAVVGHLVAHGGDEHVAPALVTEDLLESLDALTRLAPLHQPHSLAPIRVLARLRPGLTQVACFDTAFHARMDRLAASLALPRALTEDGLRRYGFHGLSCDHAMRRLQRLSPGAASGQVIVAHLGEEASLSAVRDGRGIDSSMGFSRLDGLMMATRAGTLDPGIILYLQQVHGLSARGVAEMLYNRSGLLGVSGLSGDLHDLVESHEPDAREAVALFAFRVAREAGALVSTLGGLDAIVFTGGIGETLPQVREAIGARLHWTGLRLDPALNARGAGRISTPESRIEAWVVPAGEEAMIAHQAVDLWRRNPLPASAASIAPQRVAASAG